MPDPAAEELPAEVPASGDAFVQSLARGLRVITAFDATHSAMTLSEVAGQAGISRAAARRFLHTLAELGYVRVDGRLFALTPRVLRLGTAYLSGLGLPQVAQPHLERLSAAVGESSSAAVLDGTDVVYVARVAMHRLMSVGIAVGTRFPAYATSLGRVLLAGLADDELDAVLADVEPEALTPATLTDPDELRAAVEAVREAGWAQVDQELELGLSSLAVPVRDADGAVLAAVNLSMRTAPTGDQREQRLAALLDAAAAVEADLADLQRRP